MTERAGAAALEMRGVCKSFGPTAALAGVDLTVGVGEVHALIGENGAGKSTLMKVLSGAHAADSGSVTLFGAPYAPSGPADARVRGVAMIYQELTLAPHLTVEQNVMLGREDARCGVVRSGRQRALVQQALERLAHPKLAPTTRVADLGPGARQLVEVARALVSGARIIVMDEPTSSLARHDVEHLFSVIARLAADGVSIIYISHFIEEVRRVASRFTVLRDGRTVGRGDVAATSVDAILELMAGRKLREAYPRVAHTPGPVVLAVNAVAGAPLPVSASFELRRGEIFGITGLVGAGRTELLRAIFGLAVVRAGTVRVAALAHAAAADDPTPAGRLRAGMGLLSEDRKEEGLAQALSIGVNLTLSCLAPFSRGGWLNLRRRDAAASAWMTRLGVKARGPEQPVGALSGGNQQKVALARLLHHDVDVLLLDEPTRGIDVGAKAEIWTLVGELAAAGKAVLVVSSHLPEVLGVCDRVAVMRRGVLSAARPVAEWTEAGVLAEATGAQGGTDGDA